MGLKKLSADWHPHWHAVWTRDDPWHPNGAAHFNVLDGAVLWVDEELQTDAAAAEIVSNESRYIEIPRLHHGDHHDIFREWLGAEVSEELRDLCNTASIGGFFQTLEDAVGAESHEYKIAWHEFHDSALRERATTWLRERGWAVEWTGV